eukprot:223780-Chlamydomonas_euryale.AAC.3
MLTILSTLRERMHGRCHPHVLTVSARNRGMCIACVLLTVRCWFVFLGDRTIGTYGVHMMFEQVGRTTNLRSWRAHGDAYSHSHGLGRHSHACLRACTHGYLHAMATSMLQWLAVSSAGAGHLHAWRCSTCTTAVAAFHAERGRAVGSSSSPSAWSFVHQHLAASSI